MNKFNCSYILLLLTAIFNYVEAKDGCRELNFLPCVKNETFTGHVIQTSRILAPGSDMCQHQCFLEDKCISYNLGAIEKQIRSCELSDADHVTDPNDVVPQNGSEYCPVKNPCSTSPCLVGELCTPDFLWDTFICSNGTWSPWGAQSPCLCGFQNSTRRCLYPNTQREAGNCIGPSMERQECVTGIDYPVIKSTDGVACVFPFTYNGVCYNNCTMADYASYWCAYTTVYQSKQWGVCSLP